MSLLGLSALRLCVALLLGAVSVAAFGAKTGRKIVLIAGPITGHDKFSHEYEKNVTLIKHLLDTSSNLKGMRVEAYYKGWVPDERVLDDADTIVYVTDGGDHREADHPLYVADRMKAIEKQMSRGCGLVMFHWSTFHPVRVHDKITEWVGGYFDYETGNTPNKWYSAIQTWKAETTLPNPEHPISRGVKPFQTTEEYYYNMRFRENDSRITPIAQTQPPNTSRQYPVGWAVQRSNGGRGFGFTGGHFYANWWNPDFRKMILNAIAWTAHLEVPAEGVESRLEAQKKVLILTGYHHPGHDWRNLTAALILALEQDPRLLVEVTENMEDLATSKIDAYDLLVMNYNNWDRAGLSVEAQEGLTRSLKKGKGLTIVHFANGAFNYTLPNKESEWKEYRTQIVARAWMHDAPSGHDPFGKFTVSATNARHPITKDLAPFETEDELYFKQLGTREVTPLAVAHSKVTGNLEPMAWAYNYGKGRIFQTVLGHADVSVRRAAALIRRGSVWAMREMPLTFDPPTSLTENALFRNGSPWTVERSLRSPRLVSSEVAPKPRQIPAEFPKVDKKISTDWLEVGNDKGGMRYSKLAQINRDNVNNLKIAWTFDMGEASPGSTIECTPIVVEGVMYITTTRLKILALNAATGKEIWRFDPESGGVNRGVAYWSDGKPNGERRIVMGTPSGYLYSLDARTGRLDPHFGKAGVLDLRAGIERDISKMNYGVTSAPAIFEDKIIIGIINTESQPGAPGDVRAFHIRTGREVWRFHTVPQPYEPGNETWEGDSWKDRSGTNPWSGFTVDTKRGILFCGTGSASSDFYGGDRKGANLYANCTLALNARTGKYLWHFQSVHHDLWDHDNPCPPVLVTVTKGGKKIDAVAQPTKTGFVYVFDRVTGKSLYEVKEVPATPSDIPGEQAFPTQPEPVAPPALTPRLFTDADVTNISPESTAYVRQKLKGLRYGLPYLPPTVQGTVVAPGFHGGATWSGASFDPTSGLLYVNTNNVLYINKLNPDGKGKFIFDGYTYFFDHLGYPANKPPWGHLTAVDLSKGTFAWRVPLGTYPELLAKGIPQTGTENFGGTIVTEGGLVFIGGTKDEKFHAFDKSTGKLLWEYTLPFGGYTTPSTYSVNGKQYVTIAAGGGGKLRTKSGDMFVTFALPDKP
jgi:quinoprotein glucose dehydrogenase